MKRKQPNSILTQREKVLWLKDRTVVASNGCWEWQAGIMGMGYGRVAHWMDKSRYAHRAMYRFAVAPIPDGMYVLHGCDNRLCINPAHLSVGTHLENQKDKKDKGRHNYKFSDEEISQLRRFHSYGVSRAELLRAFGISTFWFYKVVNEDRRTGGKA